MPDKQLPFDWRFSAKPGRPPLVAPPAEDYRHKPLASPDSIRVLDLLPSRDAESTVEVRLREVSPAGRRPGYEALSYVWGASAGDKFILCDGQRLFVTPNCYHALVHLRWSFRRRTLWIDAICIDQKGENTNERNNQVQMMGQIYHDASCVIIWLGLASPDVPLLFRYLARWTSRKGRSSPCKTFSEFLVYQGQERLKPAWAHLQENPWFRRVWTIQEIAFSRKATIMSSRSKIPWATFARSAPDGQDCPEDSDNFFPDSVRFRQEAAKITQLVLSLESEELDEVKEYGSYMRGSMMVVARKQISRTYGYLFRCLPDLQCTLDHDKVFGLYSLIQTWGFALPGEQDFSTPDYTRPVADVFREAIVSFISLTGTLEPLSTTLPADPATGLPSWMPNWLASSSGRGSVEASGVFPDTKGRWHASGSSKASLVCSPNYERIELKGRKVGIISLKSSYSRQTGHPTACPSFWRAIGASRPMSTRDKRSLIDCGQSTHTENQGDTSQKRETLAWLHVAMFDDLNQATVALQSADSQSPRSLQKLSQMYADELGQNPQACTAKLLESDFASVQRIVDWYSEYAFIVLDCGYVGRAHHTCEEGDDVYLLAGSDCPLVLRRQGDFYRVVAPACINGAMEGELWPEGQDELQSVTLV